MLDKIIVYDSFSKAKVKQHRAITITTAKRIYCPLEFISYIQHQYKAVPSIKYSVKSIQVYIEKHESGAYHAHGTVDITDNIKWHRCCVNYIKRDIGFILLKDIFDEPKWNYYSVKPPKVGSKYVPGTPPDSPINRPPRSANSNTSPLGSPQLLTVQFEN